MTILFNNLQWALAEEREEINAAISRVLDSGRFILGPEVEAFESEIAQYLGSKYAISCANGTDALILSLLAAQRYTTKRGVLTVANSAPPTVAAIYRANCYPTYIDVLPNGLIDHTKIDKYTANETLAIIPVDLYGQVHKFERIVWEDLETFPLVIEDGAQAMGSKQFTLSNAWSKCISFYPTKNLGALGDGGMIVTNDENLDNHARRLRIYGSCNNKINYENGFNSRLDELQAAILRVRLKYLDANNKRRQELAKLYTVLLPEILKHREYRDDENYHLFTIRTPNRKALQEYLESKNIETMIHYRFPAYKYGIANHEMNYSYLQETENFCNEVLSLPMWPGLTTGEVSRVCYEISAFFDHL